MKFLEKMLGSFKQKKEQKTQQQKEINCSYCKQWSHIYVLYDPASAPDSVPDLEPIRHYSIKPKKDTGLHTSVYDYERLIWDPLFGENVRVICRMYYCPKCNDCRKRMNDRKGAVVEDCSTI
jgi:hypothetical protein